MFASFHSNGTTPSYIDKLNTVGSGMTACSTIANSNFTPGDLLSFFLAELQLVVLNSLTLLKPQQ